MLLAGYRHLRYRQKPYGQKSIDFRKLNEEEKDIMGYEAKIDYSDGNGHIFETQKYHLTDFPLDELRLFFVDDTLMLPSEYWIV